LIQSRMQVRAVRMPSADVFSSPLDVGDPKHDVDLNVAQPGFVPAAADNLEVDPTGSHE
jgi:hypothetical protein